jgi:hypothetical protein
MEISCDAGAMMSLAGESQSSIKDDGIQFHQTA